MKTPYHIQIDGDIYDCAKFLSSLKELSRRGEGDCDCTVIINDSTKETLPYKLTLTIDSLIKIIENGRHTETYSV